MVHDRQVGMKTGKDFKKKKQRAWCKILPNNNLRCTIARLGWRQFWFLTIWLNFQTLMHLRLASKPQEFYHALKGKPLFLKVVCTCITQIAVDSSSNEYICIRYTMLRFVKKYPCLLVFWHCQIELKSAQTALSSVLTPSCHLDMDKKVPQTILASVYTHTHTP